MALLFTALEIRTLENQLVEFNQFLEPFCKEYKQENRNMHFTLINKFRKKICGNRVSGCAQCTNHKTIKKL